MGWLALWWVWMALAIGLAILEVLLPGFIFLGFALGALIVGVGTALGVSLSPAPLLAVFAALSLVSWIVLRHLFQPRSGPVRTIERDIND